MPLQNRVLPTGEIVADAWRGGLMGNRGILHHSDRTLGKARWRHSNWVCCATEFRGRWREPMPPGRYTALFFWDEVSAFAAGHRPCAECRWRDYQAFKKAWREAGLPGDRAREIDRTLQDARIGVGREQLRYRAPLSELPGGVFFVNDDASRPMVKGFDSQLWFWARPGYRHFEGRVPAKVTVLTPAPVVAVFRAGYRASINLSRRG